MLHQIKFHIQRQTIDYPVLILSIRRYGVREVFCWRFGGIVLKEEPGLRGDTGPQFDRGGHRSGAVTTETGHLNRDCDRGRCQ